MKNTYYFPHDFHARHDPKLEKLFMEMGLIGIGAYWILIEMLFENDGYLLLENLKIYKKLLKISEKNLKSVIFDSKLFCTDDSKFWSESCLHRLNHMKDKSLKARQSALSRSERTSNAQRTQTEGDAIKESKGKEIKEIHPQGQKAADFSKAFIEKAEKAKQSGFNIYPLINKFYIESKLREKLPESVLSNVLDAYLIRGEKVSEPWPYFMKVLEEKSREHFAGKEQAFNKDKRGPIALGDLIKC